jgi:hypothetical protein
MDIKWLDCIEGPSWLWSFGSWLNFRTIGYFLDKSNKRSIKLETAVTWSKSDLNMMNNYEESTLNFWIYHRPNPTVTSARSCNNVGHLFWFTILAQHETNDVILYIHSVHKHRGNRPISRYRRHYGSKVNRSKKT